MANDNYDRNEMAMRALAFELSKITSRAKAFLVMLEWKTLEVEQPNFEKNYPAITNLVKGHFELLDPDSLGSKMIFDNPLMKLAIISQKSTPNEEEETESEKFPG